MKADRFSFSQIQEIFDDLARATFFTTLDLFAKFCQIRLSEDYKEKTTFVCWFGIFHFEVDSICVDIISFDFSKNDGRSGSKPFLRSRLFRRYRGLLLQTQKWSNTFLQAIGIVAGSGLRIKIRKCDLRKEEVDILSHINYKEGARADPKKDGRHSNNIEAIISDCIPQLPWH